MNCVAVWQKEKPLFLGSLIIAFVERERMTKLNDNTVPSHTQY
jgi:hypothetical protein